MIRQTLPRSRRATYGVFGLEPGNTVPLGSGFFVSDDGLFVTCEHVIRGRKRIILYRERDGDAPTMIPATVGPVDVDADFALLRGNLDGMPTRPGWLVPDERELDVGEPVYSVGYPLTLPGQPLVFDMGPVYEASPEFGEVVRGAHGGQLPRGAAMMTHHLSPRVTSAIVSSQIAYHHMFDAGLANDARQNYIIDKALNPGNSGGPVIATETGHVHGICKGFPYSPVQQPKGSKYEGDVIWGASLYCVVRRLTYPPIRKALEDEGVSFYSSASYDEGTPVES